VGLLLLRLWFGLVLSLTHGLSKLGDLPRFIASVGRDGIPLPVLTGSFAAASEFLGGLLLALGLFTRPAGLAVFGTLFVAAVQVHASDPFTKKEFALAYAMVALALAVGGPGRLSLDSWLARRRKSPR
jgi:putative oxidoreductase